MFSSCSEWDNCYIPQNDKNKFYDEVYNDCAKNKYQQQQQQQQQQYITSNQTYETSSSFSPNNYRKISPSNEQSVNFSNNQFFQYDVNQNSCSSSSSSLSVVNYAPNNCAFQNNFLNNNINNNNNNSVYNHKYNNNNNNENSNSNSNLYPIQQRHHPYKPITNLSVQQQHQQNHYQPQQQPHQIVYQRSTFTNNGSSSSIQQQFQQHHQPQQQQQQLALYSAPPIAQNRQNYNFQPPPSRISYNNYYNNKPPLQQQQPPELVAKLPSIPCQGNQPWTYAYCYGYGPYSNQEPCQFTQIVDIEDFMNNEKRKERSRDAARCRRSRETEIFTELAQVLPMRMEDVQQLDKASVMRIAISYLKVRDMLKMFPKILELTGDLQISTNEEDLTSLNTSTDSQTSNESSQNTNDSSEKFTTSGESTSISAESNEDSIESSHLLKQTLDGFLLILSNDGDITYVTDNISDHLGLAKIDILGQQIWEYAHQCDHAELKEALNIKRNGLTEKVKDENLLEEGISTDHRDFFVRLKCTLTSRGRSINIKSASYKVIHITGHLVVNNKGDRVLVAMGIPIPHPSNIEVPLSSSTFLTKHSLDMKFTYVDDKMFNLLGYKPEDLLETSLFNCHHGIDSDSLMLTFKNVLTKGQGETCRYRFLGKYGGYCWIVTQSTIVYDKLKPQSVVCVNYVISNLEKNNEIYTLQQYEESQKLKLEEIPNENNKTTEILNENKPQEETKNQIIIIKDQKSQKETETETSSGDLQETKLEKLPHNNNNNNINIKLNHNSINDEIIIKPSIIETTTTTTNPIILIKQEPIPTIILNDDSNNPTTSLSITTAATSSISPILTIIPTTPTTIPLPPPPPSSLPEVVVLETQQSLNDRPPPIIPPTAYCPTTTVTHTIFNKNISTSSSKFNIDENKLRPKTITSSLILPKLPTTTSTQSILQLQSLNVAPRAQSVTASVFTPLLPSAQKLPSTTCTAAILAQPAAVGAAVKQITVPNQQDMNKGYLSFAEDATELTMLKEEPDDLTAHLVAPNAVDACMPLDESVGFMGEMLAGFMGPYGSLLPDDINSLDSSTSSTEHNHNTNNNNSNGNNNHNNHATATIKICNTNSSSSNSSYNANANNQRQSSSSSTSSSSSSPSSAAAASSTSSSSTNTSAANSSSTIATSLQNTTNSTNIDPFISYRDESNDTNCSQHLLSPSVTSKSPEGSSLPSLCSPNSFSQEDEFSYYTMNVDDMDDLTMRAPYIPMNEQDDLPLLTSDDYMWSSGNAFAPDEFSLHTKDADNLETMQINQSINNYQQQQFTQLQQPQQFSNSLCSSPASTVSSMSPSPIQQQQQQQQQQQSSQQIFTTDSSELAALLCGSGSGTLSILQDATNCANSLNGGATSPLVGSSCNSVGSELTADDLDNHHQLQQHCLQQLQEQLQQQQRQHHQQLLSGLNINCKKEKFDATTPSLTPNLCDSIEDTFENVYSKNSTNLDCWNEFLQINTNENNRSTNGATVAAAVTQQQQQNGMENIRQEDCKQQLHMQLQQQQNIIINAVPLITIQATNNNKNLLLSAQQQQQTQPQQQQPQQQQPQQQQQQSNTKLLNKVNTFKLTPITSTATIKIIENKQPLMQQQQQQQQQQLQQNIIKTAFIQATPLTIANNKRHLSATQIANNALDSKRIRSNNIMDLQNSNTTTSQLLQQLIATPQQQQQQQANLITKDSKGVLQSRWSSSNDNKQQQKQHQQQQHPQQSNSVLKNLLISGCDKSKLAESEILTIDSDDVSRSQIPSPDLCLSPSLTTPIQCMTSPSTVLRNYRHNPWIGGPAALPSPIMATSEDSNPPELTPCDAIDSASDSGIDDGSITENMSPLKRTYEQKEMENVYGLKTSATAGTQLGLTSVTNNNNNINHNNNGYGNIQILSIDNSTMKKSHNNGQENIRNALVETRTGSTAAGNLLKEVVKVNTIDDDDESGASMCKRKRSISYMDSSNPLMTPFLMELCNDDYNMNAKEYLQENDIENVLNEWPAELV